MHKIPLIIPYMDQRIKDFVCEVLDSGYLTEGRVVQEFEEQICTYVACKHSIAVTSCTTGLELALRALGIGPGDEVIIPDYTYPATGDAVAIVGATIVIVDVNRETMLIDYDALESAVTPRTKAVIPVSGFGNPIDYDRLQSIREKYGIHIVEDAACALGAEFGGKKVGNLADITVFSFHPRKFITTGEGGMVTTNNTKWWQWIQKYKHFGMPMHTRRKSTSFESIGTNCKMSDILAAVGVGQMKIVDELLNKRIELAGRYISMLSGVSGIAIPSTTANGKHSRQSFCIYVNKRDQVMNTMRSQGVEAQIGTYALHLQPAFSPSESCRVAASLDNSRYAFDHCLVLPLYNGLAADDQQRVVECLLYALNDDRHG